MKRLLLVTTVGLAAAMGCSSDVSEPSSSEGVVELPASAVAQIEALIAEKEARTPEQRKISSQLLYAKSGRFTAANVKAKGTGAPQLKSLLQRDDQGRVLVDVKGDLSGGLQARVEALGGKVVDTSAPHRSMRAWVSLDQLETLAAEPAVQAVRPAFAAKTHRADAPRGGAKFRAGSREERVAAVRRAVQQSMLVHPATAKLAGPITNAGSATSEGSKAHGADRARKFFNADGTGVKIGVLSDSDDFKEESIATGDLPADTVTVPGQDGRPGGGEGTAMMEIVHDVAPGAKLFFATAFNSPESFAENIRTLRFTYHCDIIVDDVIYFFESPYQDDIIAQAVNDVTDDGAMYFSSAGNEGNFDDGTSGTWEGDFASAGKLATLGSGYTVHDFGNRVISDRVELGGGPLQLHWSDPGTLDDPRSSNDYDLFVLDQDLRNVLVASTDIQDGTGLPFEFLFYFIPSNLRVVVAKHPHAKTRAIRVVLFGGELGLSTSGSSYGHNSADKAFAVAAVDVAEAGGGEFTAGPTTPVELYSSDGYRRIFYDRDGRPIDGGVTFASEGGQLRRKPELTAADGVSTSLPSFTFLNPFFGTSAAAPHAAAIAGLIKSAVPTASTARIRQALLQGALDIEGAGFDRDSGAGIVSAMNSLSGAGAKPAVFIELGTITATPTSGDVILPGGSGRVNVQITNNGGAAATNVRGTLSSSTPGVTVTQASSTYTNLAPGASATNNTPFTFSVASSVPCGTQIAFRLAVSFSGRGTNPTLLGFTVQTGRPGTGTAFSYTGPAVSIPDADPAGVDIPLTVASSGALSKLVFRIDGAACSADIGATGVGVDHTWVGDLVFRLTSPNGTTVTLINQAGGAFNSGNNFCQTVLDDAGATSIQDVTPADAPFTGTFSPANPAAAFTGENASGTWILNVSDNAFQDIGSVRAFSLEVSGFSCTTIP